MDIMNIDDKTIMTFFKKEFENVKCSKEYYDSLTNEEKVNTINKMFYNAAENIDEDWTELREIEKTSTDRWYNRYYDNVTNLYKKYMEKC